MQISVGNVTLLGIIPEESAAGFRLVPQSEVQESKAIGAASIVQFPRGNKKLTWTFSVARVHDSAEAAAYFCASYEDKFPVQDLLTYTTDAGEFYYPGAVATLTEITFDGASSKTGYRITSGGATGTGGVGLDTGTLTGGITLD